MPYSWGTVIDNTFDLQDVALHNLVRRGMKVRVRAADGDSAYTVPVDDVAAGVDLQIANYYGSDLAFASSDSGMQFSLAVRNLGGGGADGWINTSGGDSWSGLAKTVTPWTSWVFSTARVAAGLPTTKWYYKPNATYNTAAVYQGSTHDNVLLRRQKHREIRNFTDSYDLDGNTLAIGMRAWKVKTFDINNEYATSYDGRYRCVTPGSSWIRDESADADLLDNTLSAPTAPSENYAYPSVSLTFGVFRPGDIQGPWLLEEMRAVTDLFRWAVTHPREIAADHWYERDGNGNAHSGDSYAINVPAAEAAADTDWAGHSYGYFTTLFGGGWNFVKAIAGLGHGSGGWGPNEAIATVVRVYVEFGVQAGGGGVSATTLPRKWYLWLATENDATQWDANGDNVLPGQWEVLVKNDTPNTDLTALSISNPATAAEPVWPTVLTSGSTDRGWRWHANFVLTKWNVSGSDFATYCTVTD